MGRTNPTYRDWLQGAEQRWQPFRRGLRSDAQDDFDRLFERAARHADAAGYLNATDREHAMLLSMLLAQEREIQRLLARIEALESSPRRDLESSPRRDLESSPRRDDGF